MAITIDPNSVVIEATDQPKVFKLTCTVTKTNGRVNNVTVRVNSNMTKAQFIDAIRLAQDGKDNPIVDAATYKIALMTTLDSIMVVPTPPVVPEPPPEVP